MRHPSRIAAFALAVLLVAGGGLAGCSTNPATGQQAFTLMSPDQERQVGAREHPRVLESFGGAYDDPAIQAYVSMVGDTLVENSEHAGQSYTFTVLDSPVVNAFALPGGYVYVTRGLLILAGSEAELAGVLGHEIAHVTARHGAQQHGRSVLVGLGAGLLGAVIGNRGAADLLNLGGGLLLRSYSRDQEFEADSLGLRYMSSAGYHPEGMASFLARLRDKSKLDADLHGGGDPDQSSLMSTHPRTIDRVEEARRAVLGTGPSGGRIGGDSHLLRLDGMIYGDSPEEGYVRGRRFVHPVMRFEFTVPPGFVLNNGSTTVTARSRAGAAIVFDSAAADAGGGMPEYVRDRWGRELALTDLSRFTVSGMEAATAVARVTSRSGATDLRLVAIRGADRRIYRFLFATPVAETARLAEDLQRTTFSFRMLSAAEATAEKPYRVRIHEARPGDTVAKLSARMPEGPQPEDRFRVLNGIAAGQEPLAGQLLKYVAF